MDLDRLEDFLLYSLLVNVGIYIITLAGVMSLRGFMFRIHVKLFGISEDTSKKVNYQYLATYKLLLIVFNLVPWIAIQLVR